jgi:alanyl-tRNA synthetase
LVKYRQVKAKNKTEYQLVLDRTPFYAESGGQVGDSGFLESNLSKVKVLDTKKENDLIIHITTDLPLDPEAPLLARIDTERRRLIQKNHSATHLLHAALRET